jgi:hypothetical protein
MSVTLASKLIRFYSSLRPPANLPKGVEVLYPQADAAVMESVKEFYNKYYSDSNPRHLLLGINPGRFGAGVTGINFTAPRQLKENCGIDHPFGNSSELSAEFIYEVIERYGGPAKFYGAHFITSVCPLGFTKDGVNMNYYDDKKLMEALKPFIVENIKTQLSFGFNTDRCVCIGGEKNFRFLSSLNDAHKFFGRIVPVPHPRFILQYRRKQKEEFIRQYLECLSNI